MANENSNEEYVDLSGLETYARNTYLPLKGRIGTLETGKVDKVTGKGLSTNDYTTAEKQKLTGIAQGATANTGTVMSIATGAGLTGGTITESGTIKAKLKSETQSSLTAAAKGSTANREYAVGLDASGNLAVNVPWESGGEDYLSVVDGAVNITYTT